MQTTTLSRLSSAVCMHKHSDVTKLAMNKFGDVRLAKYTRQICLFEFINPQTKI